VGLAFLIQTVIAVTIGTIVTELIPDWIIRLVTLVIFLIGAVVLFRTAPGADTGEQEQEEEYTKAAGEDRSGLKAVGASFLVLFAAEWGDLSQLLTINFVARFHEHVEVFIGAWCALLTVSGLAVLVGRVLLRYMRLSLLHYIGAVVCLGLAAWSLYEIVA
ncbi:MAG: TMEM165/GDT1 family protein, partial [Nocardioidaceae bacterium]